VKLCCGDLVPFKSCQQNFPRGGGTWGRRGDWDRIYWQPCFFSFSILALGPGGSFHPIDNNLFLFNVKRINLSLCINKTDLLLQERSQFSFFLSQWQIYYKKCFYCYCTYKFLSYFFKNRWGRWLKHYWKSKSWNITFEELQKSD